MTSQQNLKDQVTSKELLVEDIVQKISALTIRIYHLSQKYYSAAAKIQNRINKVQFLRPRGNPANQWPHRPMTPRIQAFYEAKERKESRLRQEKDLLKQTFDPNRAILTCEKNALANSQFDLESEIRILKIQIH